MGRNFVTPSMAGVLCNDGDCSTLRRRDAGTSSRSFHISDSAARRVWTNSANACSETRFLPEGKTHDSVAHLQLAVQSEDNSD